LIYLAKALGHGEELFLYRGMKVSLLNLLDMILSGKGAKDSSQNLRQACEDFANDPTEENRQKIDEASQNYDYALADVAGSATAPLMSRTTMPVDMGSLAKWRVSQMQKKDAEGKDVLDAWARYKGEDLNKQQQNYCKLVSDAFRKAKATPPPRVDPQGDCIYSS